jgi:hypothetical protein
MKFILKTLIFICFLGLFIGVDLVGNFPPKAVFVRDAQAIIGLPFTPLSFAGVARRTTRRMWWATGAAVASTSAAAAAAAAAAAPPPTTVVVTQAPPPTTVVITHAPPPAPGVSRVPIGTVVPALPAGCTQVVVGGDSYSDCGGSFYKAAFQGNNLVYVVVPNPMK